VISSKYPSVTQESYPSTIAMALALIPSQWRLAQGKQLLKEAIPEIPPWVLNHPQKGFMFPLQKWLGKNWV
jgi:asparagine synthase (glutamine-hydrolysing)